MAIDWIKMRVELQTHPKVVRILSATRTDKFRTIGGLHAVWSVFDAHSEDGILKGYTPDLMDHIIGWEGFSRAMESVGWLEYDGLETLQLPEFTEHNGQSAKRRAEDQKRKRDGRRRPHSVRNTSGETADDVRTRKDKIRKEENIKETAPDGATTPKPEKPKSGKLTFDQFVDACTADGVDLIPADDPVYAYAERIGLPDAFIALAWTWFARRYADKQQTGIRGWRQTFRNAVEGNWPKLWYMDGASGGWALTTAGKQAQLEASNAG